VRVHLSHGDVRRGNLLAAGVLNVDNDADVFTGHERSTVESHLNNPTRPDPTHQMLDATEPNPARDVSRIVDPTRPDPWM